MPLPHTLCTSLRNGTRARLRYVAVPNNEQNLSICSVLLRHGYLSSLTLGTRNAPDPQEYRISEPKDQRVWAEMKYRQHRSVLGDLQLISKPSKRVFMDAKELRYLIAGRMSNFIKGVNIGEIVIVDTWMKELGIIEGREAVRLGVGGELIVRASPE